ncbi:MAG: phosphoribosylaminoimidazolesuccinocarboxamide synthase [Gammaproteobacteria bacterium]|jgi:phosphoribosylaminoimidazole-succinocarboxamide synthase|nr:phosphoribosylaminoimidazolesuccinocarboxamide synthase [Gammaproteobacteria bacterium]MBT7603180.1 phosphoribosylaminoimidazolesuccinocarboxamide synthase [Gammaproteobacteria bacterium]
MKNILHTSNIKSLKKIYQGKVRDIYEVDENNILIISTDRVSVFDVVLPTPIPEKGIILNKVSNFWFKKFEGLVENHLSNINIQDLKISDDEYEQIEGRSVIVKKLKALPIESIVRSYLIGSGYSDYLSKGSICDIELPKDMKMASKLPNIIFTPSTKAEIGNHDININFTEMKKLIGDKISKAVKDVSVKIFREAEDFLSNKDIILADTKFEFGLEDTGKLVLMDELLTPDSSRFWLSKSYEEGISPLSLDKQFIRDYVKSISWSDTMPAPELPDDIVEKTFEKYKDLKKILIS